MATEKSPLLTRADFGMAKALPAASFIGERDRVAAQFVRARGVDRFRRNQVRMREVPEHLSGGIAL